MEVKKDPKTKAQPEGDAQEIELILQTACGDEKAFESLYALYYGRLFRFICRMKRGCLDEIEEIINDVMFVVWGKAQSYNQQCRPSTWIFGIAYNKARCRFKLSPAMISWDELGADANTVPVDSDSWSKQLELENWLETAIETLSTEQRVVIELSYYYGMRYDEISQIMECSENTVKTRMFHARKKLGATLRKS